MDAFWDSLRENWTSLMHFLPRLVSAALLVLLVVGVAKVIGRTLGQLARRLPAAKHYALTLERAAFWSLSLLGLIVGLDYGDHLKGASELLVKVMAETPKVLPDPSPQVYLEQFGAQYVELLAVFWVDLLQPDMNYRAIRTEVMHGCRTALKDSGFTFSADTTASIRVSGSLGSDR